MMKKPRVCSRLGSQRGGSWFTLPWTQGSSGRAQSRFHQPIRDAPQGVTKNTTSLLGAPAPGEPQVLPSAGEDLRVRRRRGTGGTDSSKVNGLPENKLSEDFLGSSSGYSSEDDYVGRRRPPSPGSGRRSARFPGPWEAGEGALTAWESTCVWLGAAAGPPLYRSQAGGGPGYAGLRWPGSTRP